MPNFVIILADDLGYGDIGCYGSDFIETPNLDRLAAEGMRFTDFHSSGAVCSPTRAGLVTGRYQQRAGIPGVIVSNPKANRHHGLHTHEVTFARQLGQAGYSCAVFGKWHLGYEPKYNPVHHGFDRFRGYVSGNVDYFSHVDQAGFYDWWDGDQLVEEEQRYTTHLITDYAVEFIEEHKDAPFCLYLAHEAPHYPYQGPNDRPERTVGGDFDGQGSRTDKRQAYKEMIEALDESAGRVLDALKRFGLEDDTLVFFFSDNGPTQLGSAGTLRGLKGSLWEGGHRVPAIARWPGQIPAVEVCDDLAISVDLMPTMLELAGASVPDGHRLDGISLCPILTDSGSLGGRSLFWESGKQQAMRDGDWKLVRDRQDGRAELFDLSEDRAEEDSLAERCPERTKEMLEAIDAWKLDVSTGATVQPEKME